MSNNIELKKQSFIALFARHRIALVGLIVLVVLYSMALFAGFFAPYHYDNDDRKHSYNPPTKVHFFDEEGTFHLRPFVYNCMYSYNDLYQKVYTEDTSRVFPLQFFVRGDTYKLFGFIRSRRHLFGVEAPARIYVFGADSLGRDLFSRIMYGSQVSLSIGVVVSLITLSIGMIIGGISGYFGGRTDMLIMRMCEMIMMVPGFYLMLAMRAAFPLNISSLKMYFIIMFIMSFIGWAGLARVIRGMALSLREKEFVYASRALGRRNLYIITRHILPNTLSYAIVAVTLSIPGYILGESALSLLGLGIQDPYASWGNLLASAMNIAEVRFHPWILIPGVFIFVTVMAFNFVGDGLRDYFDPKKFM